MTPRRRWQRPQPPTPAAPAQVVVCRHSPWSPSAWGHSSAAPASPPSFADRPPPPEGRGSAGLWHADGMPIRVVLADDSDDVRDMLRMALEWDGRFDVVGEAANGEEAVRLVSEHQPDAIFLDLMMPVLDGLKAIPQIRTSSPETKIVALPLAGTHPSSSEAMELGATAMVQKGGARTAQELATEVAQLFASEL